MLLAYSPTQTIPDGTGILAVFANINDSNDPMNTTVTDEPIVGPTLSGTAPADLAEVGTGTGGDTT